MEKLRVWGEGSTESCRMIDQAGHLSSVEYSGHSHQNTVAQPPDYPCAMESRMYLCYGIRIHLCYGIRIVSVLQNPESGMSYPEYIFMFHLMPHILFHIQAQSCGVHKT
jgi:hypothetical protein